MRDHVFPYKVTLDDLDYMNVVGHIRWLEILHRARVEMIEAAGYPVEKVFASGLGIVARKFSLHYKKSARLGDRLKVGVRAAEARPFGALFDYDVRSDGGTPLLTARLELVFIDGTGKPTAMPDGFRAALFG